MEGILETDIAGIFGPDALQRLNQELRWEQPREKIRHYVQATNRIKAERAADMIAPKERNWVEGLGERKLVIPARTFFRWQQAEPGCWQDKKFVDEFYRDNEHCRGDAE